MLARLAVRNKAIGITARFYSDGSSQYTNKGGSASSSLPSSVEVNANVPGLSTACVHPSTQPVGPGVDPNKSGAYKVPEYFCYDFNTYYEAEVEMSKFRCPQPSALKK